MELISNAAKPQNSRGNLAKTDASTILTASAGTSKFLPTIVCENRKRCHIYSSPLPQSDASSAATTECYVTIVIQTSTFDDKKFARQNNFCESFTSQMISHNSVGGTSEHRVRNTHFSARFTCTSKLNWK